MWLRTRPRPLATPQPLLTADRSPLLSGSAQNFVQLLSQQPLVERFEGNPGLVKAAAPRLSQVRLHQIHDAAGAGRGGGGGAAPAAEREEGALTPDMRRLAQSLD